MLSALAFGQGISTGSISGTVQDVNKAVIPNATVKAVQQGTNATFTTQTDPQGYYSLKNLPVGSYTVTIEAAKFAKLQLAGIDVASGREIGLPVQTLQVGSAAEIVNVEAATPLIETTTAQVGGNFDTRAVSQLPNTGGGFDNLVLYVPGVGNTVSTNFSNRNGAGISSNGLRGRSNNFQIDGQSNNDNSVAGPSVFLSNPDVVSELQVVSNNFNAEYGRNTGTVVNYVLKSGTNNFHGSGYEFYTGNEFYSHANQEKNPILGFCPQGVAPHTQIPTASGKNGCTASDIPRDVNNRWGGTLGGPIIKNKAWFFASYQNTRERGSLTGTSSSLTPTPNGLARLQAEFPGNAAVAALAAQGPYAATVGNPHPAGNVVTGASTKGLFNVTAGGVTASDIEFANVQRSVPNPFDDTQVTGRGDWQISDKDKFFARYIWQHNVFGAGSGTISSGAYVAVPAKDQQIGLDYSRTWTNHFVQQLRFSYSRAAVVFAGGGGYPNCTIGDVTACPTNISFANDSTNSFTTFGLATNLPQDRLVNNTQWQGNNDWDFGRHSIKFGGEYDRQRSPNHFLPTINGGYTFGSTGAFNADPTKNTYVSSFSHFLQGNTSTLALADGQFNFNFKEQDVAGYVRDEYRVRDNLTLMYGIRWEWDQQAINLLHDITVQNVANGFWSPTAPTSVTELPEIPQDLNNWGPSIGFTYSPRVLKGIFGENKTVFRGGYRIAYDPAFYNIFLNVATSAPVVNLGSISNVGVPAAGTGASVQSAFFPQIPRGANPGLRSQTRVSNDFHNPYTQQWNFGIERSINSKISLESRYVGDHTVGNFQTINGNPLLTSLPALPSGVTPCTTAGAAGVGRENCDFSLLRVRTNGSFSIYHALQNELKVQNFHNMTLNVAYTWSKAIDNVSEIFASNGGVSTPIAQNPFDPTDAERGVSAQSFPHVVSMYWIYDLPFMRSQQGILGKIAGGWQWSGTYRYQIGAPITPFQNVANAACDTSFNTVFVGADSCRPLLANPNAPFDQVGRYTSATTLVNVSTGQPTTPNDVRFIVNNSFADAALCGGNPFACTVSRNIFKSQNFNQVDLTMKKSIKLTERVTTELRADLFNALNYMFYTPGTPGLNANSRNLTGVANGVAAPSSFGNSQFNNSTRRSLQLGAHIVF
jgi:hypothetical protein